MKEYSATKCTDTAWHFLGGWPVAFLFTLHDCCLHPAFLPVHFKVVLIFPELQQFCRGVWGGPGAHAAPNLCSQLLPLPACSLGKHSHWKPYFPEISLALDTPEINPAAFGGGLFHKEIFHHFIQVIHVGAHHAEGHWEGRRDRRVSTAAGAEAAVPAGHSCVRTY